MTSAGSETNADEPVKTKAPWTRADKIALSSAVVATLAFGFAVGPTVWRWVSPEEKPTATITDPVDHQQLSFPAADKGDRGYQISGTTENAQKLPAGSTLWMIMQGEGGLFYPFNIEPQPNGSWVIPANVAQFGPKGSLLPGDSLDFKLMVCAADSVQAKALWEHVRKGAADQDPTLFELPQGMEPNCISQPISVSRIK